MAHTKKINRDIQV